MYQIAVLGGDLRHKHLTRMLRNEGFEVTQLYYDTISDRRDIHIMMPNVDTVVLPIPTTRDGKTLNTPKYPEPIYLQELWPTFQGKAVLAGGTTEEMSQAAARYQFRLIDYFSREELTVMNAMATAEGAIQIAMENTEYTISGSRCLVIGYGRIGKLLSRMLDQLGAIVSVSARKQKDMAWIKSMGLHGIFTDSIIEVLPECDIVFNTVPFTVLDGRTLTYCNKDGIIIDLASAPGGVDGVAAEKLGLRSIKAPGLPGKVAPLSAAEYIKDTILNIASEESI